jgi:3-dehydroquinate synthase
MSQKVHVNLGERSYDIEIGRDLSREIRAHVERLRGGNCSFAVFADSELLKKQPRFFTAAFGEAPKYVVPSGEKSKCFVQFENVCEFLASKKIARDGVIFAFGGGVTGDLAGFAAASFLRGIAFVQVPSTLLSMVDSSVGGKTGINIRDGKNLVGAFWQPEAVFADMSLLDTLPEREFSAGMGEVIKCGMLGDIQLFERLEKLSRLTPRSAELPSIIARCCEIKAQVVSTDERETAKDNGRALLNLGHTFAHAVENSAGYGNYLHGEAVGLGLVMAARLSEKMGFLTAGEVSRVDAILRKYDLPTALREPLEIERLMNASGRDKKVRAGKLRYVVMKKLGEAATCDEIDPAHIRIIWQGVQPVR